ncbi:hypothetical protein L3Q82_004568 [Scortum barcoo]|uniref:Uncharacterized protein n=1 Tax=Scortum barcoo TaxID=214431 RepID=A0ACB8VGU1_9TELE|nr:hypothetical protein L3Q82_004568 [Scortum barcoo]
MEYNPEYDDNDDDEDERGVGGGGNSKGKSRRTFFLSKNSQIRWSLSSYAKHTDEDDVIAAHHTAVIQGPTTYVVSHALDMASTLHMFITPEIEEIVKIETNLGGVRKYGDGWRNMDDIDLRVYVGLLILAGVYRSLGEASCSLWDAESGKAIFRTTMPLKVFHTYAKRANGEKLATIREVWDKWAEQLPRLYNPGLEITVDEQLVPFRGSVLRVSRAYVHFEVVDARVSGACRGGNPRTQWWTPHHTAVIQGPTTHVVSHALDMASTLHMFITPEIEEIVEIETNLGGVRKYGDGWRNMDDIDLRVYVGLLILAGVYRSRGKVRDVVRLKKESHQTMLACGTPDAVDRQIPAGQASRSPDGPGGKNSGLGEFGEATEEDYRGWPRRDSGWMDSAHPSPRPKSLR